jgi:hypothetical protein
MRPIPGHTTRDAKRVIERAVTGLAQPDVITGERKLHNGSVILTYTPG